MSATHACLLRGINLGGNNKMSMPEFRAMLEGFGCKNVKTYIASGNAVFNMPARLESKLAAMVEKAIAERFGMKMPVVIVTKKEMEQAVAMNPYPEVAATPKLLHLMVLAARPAADAVATLDPNRSAPDRFAVIDRFIYMHLPNGAADSKLTNQYFDSRLKTVSTGRNWQTVNKILEMMQ